MGHLGGKMNVCSLNTIDLLNYWNANTVRIELRYAVGLLKRNSLHEIKMEKGGLI